MRYAVDESTSLCFCPNSYYGVRSGHSRSVPEAAAISPCDAYVYTPIMITGQETAH